MELLQPRQIVVDRFVCSRHILVFVLVFLFSLSTSIWQIPSELADPETDAREILANAAGVSVA